MRPIVSVILPFTKISEDLIIAINSILSQKLDSFELLLVDANSDADTDGVLKEIVDQDKRIKVIQEETQIYTRSLNKGIKKAKGKYIAIMGNEGESLTERLAKQVDYLDANPDTSLVGCLIEPIYRNEIDEENDFLAQYLSWSNRIISHEDISINRFIECPIIFETIMFRSNLISEYGEFPTGDAPAGFEFLLRLLENGVQMHKLPEILHKWAFYPELINVIGDATTEQAHFELKSIFLKKWLIENNPYFPEVAVWGAGKTPRQRFYILHELGIHPKFFIDLRANPTKNVIQFQHIPPAGQNFILCYVSNRAAREKIRTFLVELGYTEGKDFLCVA